MTVRCWLRPLLPSSSPPRQKTHGGDQQTFSPSRRLRLALIATAGKIFNEHLRGLLSHLAHKWLEIWHTLKKIKVINLAWYGTFKRFIFHRGQKHNNKSQQGNNIVSPTFCGIQSRRENKMTFTSIPDLCFPLRDAALPSKPSRNHSHNLLLWQIFVEKQWRKSQRCHRGAAVTQSTAGGAARVLCRQS